MFMVVGVWVKMVFDVRFLLITIIGFFSVGYAFGRQVTMWNNLAYKKRRLEVNK